MKNIVLLLCALNLYALINIPAQSKQLLLVKSNDFTDNRATLRAYERLNGEWEEVFEPIPVNLGRNGLAWGEGILRFEHLEDEPVKHEGDGKSPAGLFQLESFFGYEEQDFDFPYLKVNTSTLCIDESDSHKYNKIIQRREDEAFESFEYMKRKDDLYRIGIVVGHNQRGIKRRGSCIFIHVQKDENASTSGCTSLQEKKLYLLMQWLEIKKRPLLLQLPKAYLQEGFK